MKQESMTLHHHFILRSNKKDLPSNYVINVKYLSKILPIFYLKFGNLYVISLTKMTKT